MKIKEKLKEFARSAEMKAAGAASVAAVALTGFASAEDAISETVITAFQTGFQSMASDALKMISVIVPIALGVAGVVYLSRKAIGWFKSLAK